MNPFRQSPGRVIWFAATTTLVAVTLLAFFGPFAHQQWEQPRLLFALVTTASAVCVLAATFVIALADRREMAEVGLLGSALLAASVMPLVHGLVTPGVLYDDTAAFRTSAFLTLPIALAVASPLLRPGSAFGRWAARRWRDWTLVSLLGVFVVGSVVVFFPDAVVVPEPSHPFTIAATAAFVFAVGVLSVRQLRLFELGGHPANLVASLSILAVAMTALLPVVEVEYGAGFWWLHAAGLLGVAGACVGLAISKRLSPSAKSILAPVLVHDPLVAFELGLSPTVHRFIAHLERKDEMTRDHTVRTGELAMRVGERFHLSAGDLRDLGLAALLHEVGKLTVPDQILGKPSRLTDDEYELVKAHIVDGAQMLRAEPTLARAAEIVRSHHERVDGRGYPDGLSGSDIPLASRIVAVCDAFDSMTHDRQYRSAVPVKMAVAVLREHAGSQFDADVVRHLVAVLPAIADLTALDDVGRGVDLADDREADGPTDVEELLALVRAEI